MSKSTILIFGLITCFVSLTSNLQAQLLAENPLKTKVKETLKKNAGILRFMENKGQLDNPNALYYLNGKQGTVIIEKNRLRFIVKEKETYKPGEKLKKLGKDILEESSIIVGQHSFSMYFEEGNLNPKLNLGLEFGTTYNYFLDSASRNWVSNVRAAKDLTLEDIYPGVDLRLYSSEDGSLEFDWILEPGVSPDKINMRFSGQDDLKLDKSGNLSVGLKFTDIKFNIPESYQVTELGKVAIDFAFHIADKNKVGFQTKSSINPNYPVIIDPVLSWGTFIDGNDPDFDQYLFAIQVDPTDGMIYCAGATNRNIPTNAPPYDADGYLNTVGGFGTGATPRVAVVYRVNSTGSDLVDLTMFGPGTVSGGETVVAYGLSLSPTRVFIGGRTTVSGLPMVGSPFDNSFDNNDGFVAVFSRNLSTLHYSTYLGGTGSEDLGVTSIRAVDDNTFVCGLTAEAALPGAYISGGAAQTGFGGASDMYIARFSSLNTLTWGTYIGGTGTDVFNDLELFTDGRIAFVGSGTGTLTEVNSAASRSTGSDYDGIIGVLSNNGGTFNYLDEVGGAGNDQINDCDLNTSVIFWTGASTDGFPTSTGAYDVSHNGGQDVVVGSVGDAGGSSTWKATFFGGPGDDIGSGIQKVSQTQCDGTVEAFLLVFGTCESGIPTVNINGDPFYDATNNGGLDMYFAGFNENVTTLQYATNIGGQYNDYLGDTGAPRGANHLWVKGANIYVGTTTHSASHTPTIVGNTGFDQVKTNHGNPTSDDTHVLFSIQFTSLFETDYSDAPATYGTPSHILDCAHISIGTLDAETAPIPGVNANGDDVAGIDDEDGISVFPVYQSGGPQNISVTADNVMNTTGLSATLYGWIDFNNDGNFDNNEIATTTVANGFNGSKTLTWSGITVAGNPSNQYLRLRLTTDALSDDNTTAGLDERSTESAENGEVEDYYICVKPKAGADKNVNCLASFPGGSANMAASGTGTWTAAAGNPGTASITNNTSATTTITNYSVAGTYAFVWANSTGCATDTALVIVTAKPNAGGNQNVTCVANFPGGSATMGASGVGTWSAAAGNPGTATITSPNSPSTTITNFTIAGSYSFVWTNSSNCTDTAIITVTEKPNAGFDKNVSCVVSFPGGSTSMAATGSGTWTAHPSNQSSNIVTPGSPTTTINTFAGEGTYLYIWTIGSCTDTAAVIVTKGPVGSASPQSICSGFTSSVALNSTVPGSTFTWTAAQQSGATITGYSDCNSSCGTTIAQTLTNTTNNASGVVRYTVIPTSPNGCVGNSFTVDVTVNPKPVGSGADQEICSGGSTSISLTSTVAGTTFTWTASHTSGATITGFSNCVAACGNTISQILTNTSNSASGVVCYFVTPISPNGCAGTVFKIDVTVNPKPTGSANAETICSGSTTSVALNSTVAGSSFTWTAAQQSGATITGFSNCAAACGATIAQVLTNTTNNNAGVVRYTVTTTSPDGCTGSTFQVSVTVNPKPGVSVTTTPACIGVSNGTATAVVTGGSAPFSYDWSNGQTSATIINLANATYTVTVEDNNNCTNSASGTVQQQGISVMTANPSTCNPVTNTYSVSGSLTLVNPPATGTLTVSIGASQQVFNAPFSSPTNYTITGLTADGAVHTVNAVFSAGSQCSKSTTYTAPVNCQPIITHTKSFVSATQTGAHSFSVVYSITVGNTGGDGQYDLKDVPGFDDDIAISSASYTTNAPGNPGGALAGTGPWTLANDQAILTGQTHTYTLTVNVTIDLSAGSGGNNSYTKCGTATPGNPVAGEGLYNESRLDTNNDGTPEETKKTCGDIPYLDMTKTVASINPLGGNMYNVLYTITVKNLGGANGQYDLTDAPAFENDIAIGSASYTSNAPGNAGSALGGVGPWILASDQAILVGATHTYTLTVKVTLDLAGGGGDNVYTKCGAAIPGDPSAGEGLYNQSKLDTNNDGTNDETDEACGDLPYITTTKSVSSIVALGGNMYNVIYSITAQNIGGATGQYDLSDVPGFDDDITIGSASFTTNAPGNPGGALAGTGPWTLANDQNISVGATHTYTLTVKVTLDLRATSGGNNVYNKCGTATPGDPAAGEGLYNQSKMDSNNDGTPEETREVCADLPYIINTKSVASITPLGGNMYNVVYSIQVKNLGGVNGSYDLVDAPGFDNDFAINSAAYTSNAPGNPGLTLVGTGPWTLANDQNIVSGATHTYTLTVKVTLDLTPGSGGDNVYTKCASTNPGDPQSGEGLYNQSRVDSNNDGIAEDTSEVCSDVPYVTSNKSITTISPLGGNMYNVTYTITVQNIGGVNGQYDLKDTPGFDDDITINNASYTSNAPGNGGSALAGTGPWTLANDQTILVGATHTYTLVVKVTLDLTAGSGGNNTYTKCGTATPGDPASGEGLYNQSTIDTNNDGVAEETKEACGDLPFITTNKSITTISNLGGNMYNVTYSITVQNLGGTTGQYDLSDVPGYDDDITINSASYTSNAPGNAGAALAGTGPWTLANDQSIVVGTTHTYTLVVKVTLDLRTTSGGNNSYTKCGTTTPGDPTSGEGLYNQSKMDTNNDGTPEETKEACGDLPYITTVKTVNSVSPLGGNMFNVSYQIQVKNTGGANGTYDLIDAPGFDNDFAINSSSYTSNAPGNAGSALAGTGPWTLANDQAILSGATHTYTVVVKVTLDLTAGSGGDNVYTACGSATPGDPSSGEGLYNRARVDINNDGIPEDTSETCADVPYITSSKSLTTIAPLGGNMYNVTYTIVVQNLGASNGQYDLLDVPAFDNDITIGSASYTTTAPGNAGGALAGSGPWTLANDQAIVAGGTHTYTLVVKVTLDLTPGTGGDNIYTKCGNATPGNPTAGEGLYNESRMDSNNDGTPEEVKKACGDLPYIVTTKTFASKTDLGGNMYNVNYTITVQNLGGANGQYDLTDIPGFDDDITINNASYTSNAPGNAGAALAGIGPWTLANDQAILVGAIHTYTLTVKVTLDLNPASGGNNTYTKCGSATPGDPNTGEGLYNQSKMDTNNDGIPEEVDEACGDLPYVSTTKTVANIAALGGNMFEVKYTIKVSNSGGANGQYDLTDIPGFDDDIAINSSSYASDAPGNSGGSLAGFGPWTLANDQAIGIGAVHTYTITVKITIDLNPGSGGNNIYTRCGSAIPGDPSAGEGLYNQSKMDTNNDGIPEDTDEACGDLPYITSTKSITTIAPLGGNMYNVTYTINVQNLGAVNGQYDLTDIPGFDNDISIGSASYSTTAPGNPGGALAGSGPWTLANDQVITAGASHSYTITVKVTLNLEPGSGGDDVYTKCGAITPGDPNSGEGLYNQSKLDSNNDGVAEETKEACGDIPYVSATKTITATTALGGNMYNVSYSIVVKNLGGAVGQYDLSDVPAFDNDITIGTTSYSSTAPGNPGGGLAGVGPWTLANDQSIAVGATHTYTLTVKVTLDLNPGSGGDDTYTKCGAVNPGDPNAGEGLYNQSKLDSNNDGTPEDVDETCGDLPYVTSTKAISTITSLGGNMYNVTYAIVVKNLGGVNGTYDLSDVPGFDNDIAIGSASYSSTAPGNPGGGLIGIGPWTLANDQVIGVGATHTYTLTVKVTLDLRVGTSGDNIYTKCGNAIPGDPSSGEGLYNQSRLDSNNDGTPEETKEACGDLPYIVNTKTVNSITPLGGNMFNVKYNIAVKNIGGANGQYDLTDVPGFDNDFAIGSASYSSDAPGNAGNALAGSGPWVLANDQALATGATHNYAVTVKVTLDLSPGSGGDNIYTKCGSVNPADPNSGEGLYNLTKVDINNDGIPEDTSETCADIPYVTSAKTINSITSLGGHMYNVVYKIVVKNLGGAAGQYDLLDVPGFDNDIAIGSASYSSDAPGNAGSALAGVGPWSLANDQGINANSTHTYLVTVKVTLDLNAASGGDNIYTKCGQVNPNNPQSGEGLYNESRMDSNNDGTPEEVSKVCGDLPYVVSSKSVTSVTPLGNNMFNVTYKMVVQNLGGINGPYDLIDVPGFDDDITINTASYTSDAPGNPGGPLAGVGPWLLANDQNIVNGAVHTYNLTVKVTLNLDPASPGNNTYTKCGAATPGDPNVGEGLYNQARLDINNDGVPEDVDEACGDVPYVTASKTIASITPLGANMYTVKYQINVQNLGGTAGMYDLVDQPGLDDDITMGSVSYTSDAPGNSGGSLIGSGPWTLANDQAIGIGSTHSYIITTKVTLDLSIGSSGDNIYTKCGNSIPGDPTVGEGLYNQSKLDNNNDGIPEELDEVCGDLPYVTTTKTLTNISNLGGHMYDVTYQLEVKNLGGANGQYDLTDVPGFDNDIAIGSASFLSSAPGNPGAALIGTGPWILANDQNIGSFSTHIYTLTVKVTLNLESGSGGDDIYTKCGAITPGDPTSGEGLYNQSKMDSNNDGVPEELREACGDIPYVVNAKTISSITPLGGNMYNVVYQLVVKNLGGANGQYDLTDIPGFDNDIVINSASFTTTGPGAAGTLAGVGPWTLANDLVITPGATHTYTVTVKVTIQMEGGAGNDVYTKCGNATPGDPTAGEGLYNQAKLDINNDGTPEDVDEACGDLPYVTAAKTVANITNLGGHMYNVTYNVVVRNIGGALGQYDLNDIPGFDDDITINSSSYTSNAPGNAGGPLVGVGPWNLANDQNINAGATHTYVLTVKVTIDLRATSNGDNIYTACGQLSTPGDPSPGEGLYNQSTMDSNNDGIPEEFDETCADLPYVVSSKTITSIIPLGGGMHTINYQLRVQNLGGAIGQYDLTDAPGFDDDLTINTASFTSTAPGNPGGALAGIGPWVLANDQSIGIGSTHTYNLTAKATLDFRQGSGGDNVYSECGKSTPGTPKAGEGVFNQSRMDINNDGTPEDIDDVCGDIDIVDMAIRKSTATPAPYSYGQLITFNLEVFNQGNITLTSVVLNDYLPSGFTFSPADNIAGWNQINSSLLEYNAVASVPKYSSVIVPLKLRVAMSSGYKAWFNYSEVKSYKDVSGTDRTFEELDSKPNSNTPAELAVKPGDPGDNDITTIDLGGNEDDHDPAGFDVFDLALRKICKGALPLTYGELVPFEITVFNQGSISATNAVITDYVPVGFQFIAGNNPGWSYNAGTREASYTITNKIKPGDSTKVNINLILNPILNDPESWSNIGEIESVTDTLGNALKDFDSTPGGTKDDDGPSVDNAINDPNDEDDHDPSTGPVYDLAMKVIVINKAPYYIPGQVVPYTMRVFNQGNITAMSIQINDYLPQGYSFDPGLNTGWGFVGSTLVYNSIPKLVPGDSVDIPLKLTVQVAANPTLQDWDNYAELRSAMDDQGVNKDNDDADSKPNTNSVWEKQVTEGHPWDNLIDGNGQPFNEDEDDHDFENVEVTGAIGDRVWDDLDGNGIQNPGEPGLKNVIAILYDCNTNAIVKKDTTDASGKYLFDFLLPFNKHYVRFDFSLLTTDYGFTFANQGVDDNIDSDVNATGVGPCITIEPGKRDTSYDAGLVKLGSFSDFVWEDKDGDGIQELGEPGIQGVKVTAFNAITKLAVKSTITDNNGYWIIDKLMPGDYYLKFEAPSNYNPTTSNSTVDFKDSDVDGSNGVGTTANTYLSPGEDDTTTDAGFFRCAMIGGRVYFDADLDGIFDSNENGLNGLEVYLIDAMTGVQVAKLKTAVNPATPSDDGYYKFACVKPGMYYVKFERPGHLAASDLMKGSDRNKDSDIGHENGVNTSRKLTILSNDMILNLGAGFQDKAMVGDFVWLDANANGIQDSGEQPMENVHVYAVRPNGTIVSETMSEADGHYALDGIAQGDYFVRFEPPSFFGFTTANQGSDPINSDVDGVNGYGTTRTYRINAGDERPSIDAGLVFQVLPLEWLSFEGRYNGSFTELDWKTGVEINNDRFEVERRHESETNFTKISVVDASSDRTSQIHEYNHDDYDVARSGIYYYRIKQVDKNGTSTYSKTISIRVNQGREMTLSIYPNPTDESLTVDLGMSEDSELEVRVFDEAGKNVLTNPFGGYRKAGSYREAINTSILAVGQYNLQIKTSTGIINKKFTVTR